MRIKGRFSLILGAALAGAGAAGVASYIYFSQSDRARLIDPDHIVTMSEVSTVRKPKNVTFVEITLSGPVNSQQDPVPVRVSYSRIAHYIFPGQSDIKGLVDSYLDGSFKPGWVQPTFNDEDEDATGLSLENKTAKYFVFVLKCANCQFAKKQIPFRVEDGKHRYHFNPRVVWKTTSGDVEHEKRPSADAAAKIGYFIALSDNDYGANGNFRSSFNIYLDLIDQDGDVPISIDPDVGYPGGNK
jgi:hypothetical protein